MAVRLALVAVGVTAAGLTINAVTGPSGPAPTIGGWAYPVGSGTAHPPESLPPGADGSPDPEWSVPTPPWPSAVSLVPVTGGGPVPGAGPDRTPPRTTGPSRTGAPPATPASPKPSRPGHTPADYPTIQAEDYDGQNGVRTESWNGGRHIGFISTGDWVRYNDVDFTGDAARSLLIRASNGARQNRSGRVELRLDRRSNPPVGSMTIPNNGDWYRFSTYRMRIPATTGVHTVYLTFTSGQDEEFANIDWLRFRH
jgi:hypothetical protein